jgi:hypothetical protein
VPILGIVTILAPDFIRLANWVGFLLTTLTIIIALVSFMALIRG